MLAEHTRLEVTLPPSAGGQQLMQIWVGPQEFEMQSSSEHPAAYVKYAPPHISSCTDLGSPGDIMSITGQNFGNSSEVVVRIAGNLCRQSKLRELHHRISCQVPEPPKGNQSKLSVEVCIAGQWSAPYNHEATFSYKGKHRKSEASTACSFVIHVRLRP